MVQGSAALDERRAAFMESFSRTLDKYTGSYVARRRRRRITIALAIVALAAAATAVFLRLGRSGAFSRSDEGRPVPKREILADWDARKWHDARSKAATSLAAAPLDPFYLSFRGLAAFYEGMELPEGEQRTALIDESIASLRKAIAAGGRIPLAQIQYVLGKAYYEKGEYYLDESAAYMDASLSSGYVAKDSREYLAVAYSRLGQAAKAVASFEAALAQDRSAPLLIAAAKAYVDSGAPAKAEGLLLEAIASGTDEVAVENGRLLLGDIYRDKGDLGKAEEQFSLVLEKDPGSAEAHYRLGLVWQSRGDPIKARAEWRKAVSIDPMHAASRQKLTERL
jgi:tetratricopeptide (TPR) repeat protein